MITTTKFEPEDIDSIANKVIEKIIPKLSFMNKRFDEGYITKDEVCKLLSVKPSWLDNNASKLCIPRHKVGRSVRYKRAEIQDWIRKQ